MSKDISSGIPSIRAFVEQTKLPGVHGPLYDLFEVEATYQTAIEAAAGPSLFQVVVDNDEVATRLMEHLSREKSGRVTFMPLNRIKVKDVAYPETKDALPAIKRLRFDPKLEKAFQQALGTTLICRDLEVAEELSKTHNLNCVTLAGHQVSKKGAFTGGFVESSKSKLATVTQIKKIRDDLRKAEISLNEARNESESTVPFFHFRTVVPALNSLNSLSVLLLLLLLLLSLLFLELSQQAAQISGEIDKISTNRQDQNNAVDALNLDIKSKNREKETAQQEIDQKKKALAHLESEIHVTTQKMEAYKGEIGTPLKTGLTAQENQEVTALSKDIDTKKQQLSTLNNERAQVSHFPDSLHKKKSFKKKKQ